MKKLLLILFLTLILVSPVSSTEEIKAPGWSEFCPEKYVNAEYIPLSEAKKTVVSLSPYCDSDKKWVRNLVKFTVLPALDCRIAENIYRAQIMKKNEIAGYWISRRDEYEKEISSCNNPKIDKTICLLQVKQLEEQRNNQLKINDIMAAQAFSQSMYNLNTQSKINQANSNINNIHLNNIMRGGY